ncbi:hypothetical protein CEXT_280061 [Caerostris extrusa]|uniref:Uncharacterized protein n=1 Tax=Caerostris extrusa TaxID=172846 RepID=A0AAV4XY83_CAEEX|nr:hypothetical protein CEXT_280061 [Caerostris extrusa]
MVNNRSGQGVSLRTNGDSWLLIPTVADSVFSRIHHEISTTRQQLKVKESLSSKMYTDLLQFHSKKKSHPQLASETDPHAAKMGEAQSYQLLDVVVKIISIDLEEKIANHAILDVPSVSFPEEPRGQIEE